MKDREFKSEWDSDLFRGRAAATDLEQTLSKWNLVVPEIPAGLVVHLRITRLGWAWGTADEVQPLSAYMLDQLDLVQMLDISTSDFWMLAHRGHGSNSYGGGVLAKVGPLFVSQQSAYGGVYMDSDYTRAQFNEANEIWNRTSRLIDGIDGPTRLAILWSDYRGYAVILSNDRSIPSVEDQYGFANSDWFPIASGSVNRRPDNLDLLLRSDDRSVVIAAEHLADLVDGANYRRAIRNEVNGVDGGMDSGDK